MANRDWSQAFGCGMGDHQFYYALSQAGVWSESKLPVIKRGKLVGFAVDSTLVAKEKFAQPVQLEVSKRSERSAIVDWRARFKWAGN